MNRRGFLGILGAAAAVALVGELPSSKTFFLPPPGGWRATDAAFRKWTQEIIEAMAQSMLHTKQMAMARVLQDTQYQGFGIASIKPEGESIAYEHVPYSHPGSLVMKPTHITVSFCPPRSNRWHV